MVEGAGPGQPKEQCRGLIVATHSTENRDLKLRTVTATCHFNPMTVQLLDISTHSQLLSIFNVIIMIHLRCILYYTYLIGPVLLVGTKF